MNAVEQPTAKAIREYMVSDVDAVNYTRNCGISGILLLTGYILFVSGIIPFFSLALIVAVTLPRWIINFHELSHIYSHKQVNGIIRCLAISPVPLSIFTLSYEESREIHFNHHREPAEVSDPDSYHIRGNFFWVCLNSFTSPEQSFIRFVKAKGLNFRLGIDLLIKLAILTTLVWFGQEKFIGFWLSLRIVYFLGDIVFFRFVHHQKGEYGTFQLCLPATLVKFGELIFGKIVIQATIHHDIHHNNPAIAVHNLATVRQYIN